MPHEEGRILLVEDLHDWKKEFERILYQYSSPFELILKTAETLQKASDLLKNNVYDLVLLDLRLKDWKDDNFEGFELMDMIKKKREEVGTQIIIVSAYAESRHVRDGFKKFHIFDYFDKSQLNEQEFCKSVVEAIIKAYEERGDILDNM